MGLNFQNRESSPFSKVLLVVLVVASIALMTAYAREDDTGALHRVQGAAAGIVAPFKSVGANVGALLEGVSSSVDDATASEGTLSALRQQNAELTELLTQAEEYRQEVERLQDLLDLKDTYDIEGVAGRVIGRSTDAWNQTVTIDVGSDDGIETGLTVMGPSGVVGQVISVSAGSSTVRLLSDPQSGAAAVVQSSRAEGIVRGSLTGLLYLEDIDADVVLEVGDVVLTSGLGGSYTAGLLIGTIVSIEGDSGDGTQSVIVSPNEEASVFEEVLVVLSAASDSSSDDSSEDSSSGGSSEGSSGDGSTGEEES